MHPEPFGGRAQSSAATTKRFTGWIPGAALLVLATAILLSPHELIFDERYYVQYVELLRRDGLTFRLLEELPGATGPLFGVVHYLLEPMTGLDPVWMRLATFGLLLTTIALVGVGLRGLGEPEPWTSAAAIIGVPMIWVISGMALTSMPAMVFVAGNLALQLRGIVALERAGAALAWFAAAGVVLGLAVLGRQTTGVLAVTPLFLAIVDRRLLVPVLLQAAIATAMALPLLFAWGGLAPPLDDTLPGFKPSSALLTLGYLFVALLFLMPRPPWLLRGPSLAAGAILLALNAGLGLCLAFPIASLVDNFLDERGMRAYGIVCGSLLLWCALNFCGWIFDCAWQSRRDVKVLLLHAGLLATGLVPAFIGTHFSSRYSALALPYLILAAAPYRASGRVAIAKLILGCLIGLGALLGYYFGELSSELVRTIRP